jgi:transposase
MRRRTLRCPIIQPDRVVIGVDIAKKDSVAVAQMGDGTLTKPLRFETSAAGFHALLAYAERAVRASGARGFVVALEPTGHYGWPLVCWLLERGVEVFRVEPLHTSRVKELYDGTRRKTDAKDAVIIADLCRRGLCGLWRVQTGAFAELRVLTKRRQQLVKQRSAAVNRLHRHLDVVFPELQRLFAKTISATVLALLQVAPLPSAVLAMELDALTELLLRASRGQLGQERAVQLRQAALTSIGTREGTAAHTLAIRHAAEELAHTRRQLQDVEGEMLRQLAAVPYARRLSSIPGLGRITTATLLGEFGDLRGYRRAAQLIKMAGLDLVEISSGQLRGKRHISRRGRSYARQMLYLAALRLGNGVLAEPRRRMVEDHKVEPMKAAVANVCRLLRIIHALARDDVDFEAGRYEPAEVSSAA